MTPTAVYGLAGACAGLECVDLTNGWVWGIGDFAVRALAAGCSGLQRLCLAQCWGVGDGAIQAVAEHCSRLRCLDISGCPEITDTGLQALAAGCGALEYIDISTDGYCVWCAPSNKHITDEGIRCLAANCRQLTHVYLDPCSPRNLTDAAVEALATLCDALLVVSLWNHSRLNPYSSRVSKPPRELLQARHPRCTGFEVPDADIDDY